MRGVVRANFINETFNGNGENFAEVLTLYQDYREEDSDVVRLFHNSTEEVWYDYSLMILQDLIYEDWFKEATGNQSLGCIYLASSMYLSL